MFVNGPETLIRFKMVALHSFKNDLDSVCYSRFNRDYNLGVVFN